MMQDSTSYPQDEEQQNPSDTIALSGNENDNKLEESEDSDEEEYEFEYSTSETEEIYVTLDLTAHVPPPQGRGKRKRSSTRQSQNQTATPRPSSPSGQNGTPQGDVGRTTGLNEAVPNTPPKSPNAADDGTEAQGAEDQTLKLYDLDTDNPIILYQGRMFSCHWAETLGTDLLFYKPPGNQQVLPHEEQQQNQQSPTTPTINEQSIDDNDDDHNGQSTPATAATAATAATTTTTTTNLRQNLSQRLASASAPTPQFQPSTPTKSSSQLLAPRQRPRAQPPPLLAAHLSKPMISTTRLVAKPATLRPRSQAEPFPEPSPEPPATKGKGKVRNKGKRKATLQTQTQTQMQAEAQEQAQGEQTMIDADRAARQTAFLQRLARVKAAKGEEDVVPMPTGI